MEQGRAPAVLLPLLELARRTAAGPRDHREADLPHDHRDRAQSHLSPGPAEIPDRPPSDEGRNDAGEPPSGQVPWRLELHDPAPRVMINLLPLIIDASLGGAHGTSQWQPGGVMGTTPTWYLPVAIALLWTLLGCATYLADI